MIMPNMWKPDFQILNLYIHGTGSYKQMKMTDQGGNAGNFTARDQYF